MSSKRRKKLHLSLTEKLQQCDEIPENWKRAEEKMKVIIKYLKEKGYSKEEIRDLIL